MGFFLRRGAFEFLAYLLVICCCSAIEFVPGVFQRYTYSAESIGLALGRDTDIYLECIVDLRPLKTLNNSMHEYRLLAPRLYSGHPVALNPGYQEITDTIPRHFVALFDETGQAQRIWLPSETTQFGENVVKNIVGLFSHHAPPPASANGPVLYAHRDPQPLGRALTHYRAAWDGGLPPGSNGAPVLRLARASQHQMGAYVRSLVHVNQELAPSRPALNRGDASVPPLVMRHARLEQTVRFAPLAGTQQLAGLDRLLEEDEGPAGEARDPDLLVEADRQQRAFDQHTLPSGFEVFLRMGGRASMDLLGSRPEDPALRSAARAASNTLGADPDQAAEWAQKEARADADQDAVWFFSETPGASGGAANGKGRPLTVERALGRLGFVAQGPAIHVAPLGEPAPNSLFGMGADPTWAEEEAARQARSAEDALEGPRMAAIEADRRAKGQPPVDWAEMERAARASVPPSTRDGLNQAGREAEDRARYGPEANPDTWDLVESCSELLLRANQAEGVTPLDSNATSCFLALAAHFAQLESPPAALDPALERPHLVQVALAAHDLGSQQRPVAALVSAMQRLALRAEAWEAADRQRERDREGRVREAVRLAPSLAEIVRLSRAERAAANHDDDPGTEAAEEELFLGDPLATAIDRAYYQAQRPPPMAPSPAEADVPRGPFAPPVDRDAAGAWDPLGARTAPVAPFRQADPVQPDRDEVEWPPAPLRRWAAAVEAAAAAEDEATNGPWAGGWPDDSEAGRRLQQQRDLRLSALATHAVGSYVFDRLTGIRMRHLAPPPPSDTRSGWAGDGRPPSCPPGQQRARGGRGGDDFYRWDREAPTANGAPEPQLTGGAIPELAAHMDADTRQAYRWLVDRAAAACAGSGDAAVRGCASALSSLGNAGPLPDELGALVIPLAQRHPAPEVRAAALFAMRRAGAWAPRPVVRALLAAFQDTTEAQPVRMAALEGLRHLGGDLAAQATTAVQLEAGGASALFAGEEMALDAHPALAAADQAFRSFLGRAVASLHAHQAAADLAGGLSANETGLLAGALAYLGAIQRAPATGPYQRRALRRALEEVGLSRDQLDRAGDATPSGPLASDPRVRAAGLTGPDDGLRHGITDRDLADLMRALERPSRSDGTSASEWLAGRGPSAKTRATSNGLRGSWRRGPRGQRAARPGCPAGHAARRLHGGILRQYGKGLGNHQLGAEAALTLIDKVYLSLSLSGVTFQARANNEALGHLYGWIIEFNLFDGKADFDGGFSFKGPLAYLDVAVGKLATVLAPLQGLVSKTLGVLFTKVKPVVDTITHYVDVAKEGLETFIEYTRNCEPADLVARGVGMLGRAFQAYANGTTSALMPYLDRLNSTIHYVNAQYTRVGRALDQAEQISGMLTNGETFTSWFGAQMVPMLGRLSNMTSGLDTVTRVRHPTHPPGTGLTWVIMMSGVQIWGVVQQVADGLLHVDLDTLAALDSGEPTPTAGAPALLRPFDGVRRAIGDVHQEALALADIGQHSFDELFEELDQTVALKAALRSDPFALCQPAFAGLLQFGNQSAPQAALLEPLERLRAFALHVDGLAGRLDGALAIGIAAAERVEDFSRMLGGLDLPALAHTFDDVTDLESLMRAMLGDAVEALGGYLAKALNETIANVTRRYVTPFLTNRTAVLAQAVKLPPDEGAALGGVLAGALEHSIQGLSSWVMEEMKGVDLLNLTRGAEGIEAIFLSFLDRLGKKALQEARPGLPTHPCSTSPPSANDSSS
ncbi:hypothetical protein PAPYR_1474 [Paratrimastix pyriformis]|uniref:Uncharacterized protein n=1 Tax=Paratrimastix pyriformis TaxID=342808 RepID=A0ABQ8URQ9_9EUKA|nr:hypothetical protein PAPYR_1474 [Paratrimastix pyriformis]